MNCLKCQDTGWVCENHPEKPFDFGCCGGAGMPCECNKTVPPWNFGLPQMGEEDE